ncbi:MAG TPA: SDR family oxidoreductase [Acidimicrobiales bacterium]|nr:SDR family oxidoreductase [Acidimicrobiales bacterium]
MSTPTQATRPGGEFDLGGKVVLLTGARGQIGSEAADAFAAHGAFVVVTDIGDAARLEDQARDLRARHAGARAIGVELDVTSADSVAAAFAVVAEEFGRVDVLVNNAAIDAKFDASVGAIEPARFESYPLELWERSVAVNLTGLMRVTQAALQVMLPQGSGNIVNVGSSYGVVSPNQALYETDRVHERRYKPVDYVGTKSAIANLTRYWATLYAREGIRCNCLVPHGIDNAHDERFRQNFASLSPIGRMCAVEELRGPFVFLASDASSYMTGSVLVVDGGWTAW